MIAYDLRPEVGRKEDREQRMVARANLALAVVVATLSVTMLPATEDDCDVALGAVAMEGKMDPLLPNDIQMTPNHHPFDAHIRCLPSLLHFLCL